jgi:hypothetical protein
VNSHFLKKNTANQGVFKCKEPLASFANLKELIKGDKRQLLIFFI